MIRLIVGDIYDIEIDDSTDNCDNSFVEKFILRCFKISTWMVMVML